MLREIRPLTSLRGIAALLVVVFHFRLVVGDSFGLDAGTAFFANGYLWVDLFFVLSGFVITYAYAADFETTSLRAYGRFLWRRLARIYPLHALVLLALVPTELAKYAIGWYDRPPFATGNTPGELAAGLALMHSWGIFDHLTWNWPSWSISTEWAAYLLFPLLLPVFYRARLAIVLAAMPALLAALFALVTLYGRGDLDITFDFGVLRCLLSFALGMAAFRLYEAVRDSRLARPSEWLLAGGILWVVLAMHFDLHPVLVVPGFVALVLFAALGTGPVTKLLGIAPLHFLGQISYSIYLVQYPVQRIWHMLSRKLHAGEFDVWSGTLSLIAVVAIVIAISSLTYHFVERPARRWMVQHPPQLWLPAARRRVIST
jgi:peptidoglycan/LPS O-acetylase OafA/YrhL